MNAAVRLMARHGAKAATVRSIAREAGVTEGALYRHYVSKQELCLDVYTEIVTEMTRAKRAIASRDAPARDKIREWVRVSYEFFDHHADAFTFVLLTPHGFPEPHRDITEVQGQIFMDLVRQAQATGEMKSVLPELALGHFTGVMLNVPRMINAGTLKGPASKYVDDVADAAWRMLCAESQARRFRGDGPPSSRPTDRAGGTRRSDPPGRVR